MARHWTRVVRYCADDVVWMAECPLEGTLERISWETRRDFHPPMTWSTDYRYGWCHLYNGYLAYAELPVAEFYK